MVVTSTSETVKEHTWASSSVLQLATVSSSESDTRQTKLVAERLV